jgi:hypothetical protein
VCIFGHHQKNLTEIANRVADVLKALVRETEVELRLMPIKESVSRVGANSVSGFGNKIRTWTQVSSTRSAASKHAIAF